jgi:hypothetical protein
VTHKASATVPARAVRGVVKSISTFYVVVAAGSGKKARDITFVLDAATEEDEEITIGATVSVHYRMQGQTFVATAVAAHVATAVAAHAPTVAREAHSRAMNGRVT